MSIATQPGGGGGPSSSGLADIIETILDKGLVIDAYVRVSLIGIEVLTIDTRIVVASVDTYLRFAQAVNRLDISQEKEGLPQLIKDVEQSGARIKTRGAAQGVLEAAAEKLKDFTSESASRSAANRRRREEDY